MAGEKAEQQNSLSVITDKNASVWSLKKTAWQFLIKLNRSGEHQDFGKQIK